MSEYALYALYALIACILLAMALTRLRYYWEYRKRHPEKRRKLWTPAPDPLRGPPPSHFQQEPAPDPRLATLCDQLNLLDAHLEGRHCYLMHKSDCPKMARHDPNVDPALERLRLEGADCDCGLEAWEARLEKLLRVEGP